MQQTGSELELAYNPSDLDISCVNEGTRLDDTEGGARHAPEAGREESSSGDESSDSEGGDLGRDEAMGPLRKNVRGCSCLSLLSPPAGRWTILSLASCLTFG